MNEIVRLLIELYGIEIAKLSDMQNQAQLLIELYGIEICLANLASEIGKDF